MDISISKEALQTIHLQKQVYETEEQFMNKIVFYLCCLDSGIEQDRAETFCNVYRNKCKYKVSYPEELENEIKQIMNKYKIN